MHSHSENLSIQNSHHTINISLAKAKSNLTLYYLANFTQKELEQLTDQDQKSFILDHHKSVVELEATIADYWKSQWYYRVENWLANASNILYIIFQVNTSNTGVTHFVNVFNPNLTVANSIGYGIGIPTSLMGTSVFMLAFSAYKEAIKSTLKYAYRPPISERLKEEYLSFCVSPAGALRNRVSEILNRSILLTANYTGAMSEMVEISNEIMALPTPLNWLAVISILHYGNHFVKKYMEEAYFEGLKFWLNKKNHPWLLGEIKRGNFTTPIQILLQGVSAAGLRTYPLYYYLAKATAVILGDWIPAPLVATCVAWQGLCVLYPKTYELYMKDKIQISALIKEKILPNSANTQEEFIKIRRSYESVVITEQGRGYVFKEPMTAIAIACRTAIGGFLGWQTATYMTDGMTIPALSVVAGAGLLGGMLYRAEAERLMNQFIYKKIAQEKTVEEKEVLEQNSPCEIVSDSIAKILNLSSGIVTAMSTIGAGARLLGDSPFLSAIIILAIERSMNMMQFNGLRVQKTLRDLCVPIKVSRTPQTLFNHDDKRILEAKTSIVERKVTPLPQIAEPFPQRLSAES